MIPIQVMLSSDQTTPADSDLLYQGYSSNESCFVVKIFSRFFSSFFDSNECNNNYRNNDLGKKQEEKKKNRRM